MALSPASSRATTGVTGFSKSGSTALTGAVTISEGSGVTLTQAGQDVAIASAGAVASVFGRSGAVVAASNDYTVAQVSGAVAAIGGVVWTVVTKASDESVASSTALQADDELLFTAVSGGVYEIEAVVIYASPAGAGTPDLKIAAGEDATTRGEYYMQGLNTADAAGASGISINNTSANSFGTAAANRAINVFGNHVGNGGTFAIYWAQVNSGVNATVVRAGSVLRYRRLV